ncbi:MAG: sarcosine oxidase subunit gamma family protein [Pseudomonadota bacterium]
MSDTQSALPGAHVEGAVLIEEAGLRGMITLKGDLAAARLHSAATSVAGVDYPGQGAANCVGEKGLCWMAPDELLILVPYADAATHTAAITSALAETHHLVANVSDARALFTVRGPAAREVLAKLTPTDLHPDSFQPGQFRRTRLAQAPAAFWMRDAETFEVIVFRSMARYVFDLLANAANPAAAAHRL